MEAPATSEMTERMPGRNRFARTTTYPNRENQCSPCEMLFAGKKRKSLSMKNSFPKNQPKPYRIIKPTVLPSVVITYTRVKSSLFWPTRKAPSAVMVSPGMGGKRFSITELRKRNRYSIPAGALSTFSIRESINPDIFCTKKS